MSAAYRTYDPQACTACPFSHSRRNIVADEIGEWYEPGGIFVLGEAPGFSEDLEGRPFIGDSGRYLTVLLNLAGIARAEVYVTNTVRCRPPQNATPTKAQREYHRPFVEAALAWAQPLVILAVGGSALAWLDPTKKLTHCHGWPFRWRNSIVVPMFHPAYAMRNPAIWPLLYADFTRLQDLPEPQPLGPYQLMPDDAVAAWLTGCTEFGFDLETTDELHEGVFYPHQQQIVGYSVARAPGEAVFVTGLPGPQMQRLLEDAAVLKVCHNTKFEAQLLAGYGVTLRNFTDTKLQAYLLGHYSTHLKDLSLQELAVEQLTLDDVTQGRPTAAVQPAEWVPYAAADADVTLRLHCRFTPEIEQLGEAALLRDYELPVIPVLAAAERRGVMLDTGRLAVLSRELHDRQAVVAEELAEWFPGVNLNSTEQLTEVIFSKAPAHFVAVQTLKTRTHLRYVPAGLGLRSAKRTPTRQLALDKEVVEQLRDKHPALAKLAEYRQLGDYLSDFVDKLPRIAIDGVLHPKLHQAGNYEEARGTGESPATGRLSSSDPNIMQIPKRDARFAGAIRRAFVARPGYVWVSADMEQQEPRIAAVVAGDAALIDCFERSVDVYMEIATEVKRAVTGDAGAVVVDRYERDRWGLEYRDTAKNKVFLPVLYGANAGTLVAHHPGLTIKAAGDIITALRRRFPRLVDYAERTAQELRKTGYAVTLFGRRRWLPGVWAARTRAEAERQAANHRIQGTAADVLKGCLVWLFGPQGVIPDAHLLFPVHDEINAEVPCEAVGETVAALQQMTTWFTAVTLPIKVSVGPSWGELKEV